MTEIDGNCTEEAQPVAETPSALAPAVYASPQTEHAAAGEALDRAKQRCLAVCSSVHVEYDANGRPTPESLALDASTHDQHRAELEAAYARFAQTGASVAEVSQGRVGG